MLQLDDRRRLDIRADALERAGGVGVGPCTVGRAVGGSLDRPVCRAVSGGFSRGVRLTGTVRLAECVRDARAVRDPRAILTADGRPPTARGAMEDELVASGGFVRIETRGSRSGLVRAVTVGFVDDDQVAGAILVAATAPDAAWAGNLLADPACHVRVGERSFDAIAEPLDRADHARAVRGMILRYGTPAEGLGHGPSFRLRPVRDEER